MGQDTKWKLTHRNGNWSAREVGDKRRRVSLGTKDKEVALVKMASELGEVVLLKENQKHLALAKAHLKLVDPKMDERTWGDLLERWTTGPECKAKSTLERRKRGKKSTKESIFLKTGSDGNSTNDDEGCNSEYYLQLIPMPW